MIRLSLLILFASSLCILALRRWYIALCGLLFLTVVMQHPSMPPGLLGIQGVSAWNLALLFIVFGWAYNRQFEPPATRPPRWMIVLLGAYFVLVLVAGLVAVSELSSFQFGARGWYWRYHTGGLIADAIVNPLKFAVIGVLFFDGASTRQRVLLGMAAAAGSCVCYAALLFKSIGVRIFTIDYQDARRLTDKLVGLFANDMAELFAFAIWALLLAYALLGIKWQRACLIAAVVLVVPPFVALKSRAGFLAFVVAGLLLGIVRWRRILIVLPIVALLAAVLVPSIGERVLTGVGGAEEIDWEEATAGRVTGIWPPVIQQIGRAPFFGHGRFAIVRTECALAIRALEGSVPGHPHNSYLEMLLDGGLLGLGIALSGMAVIAWSAFALVRTRGDPLLSVLGGMALVAVATELAAGVAGSSFFPSQSTAPYVCVWGMCVRVHIERQVRIRHAAQARGLGFARPRQLARAYA